MAVIQLERNGALSGVHGGVRPKTKLTEPALSETLISLANPSAMSPFRAEGHPWLLCIRRREEYYAVGQSRHFLV